MGETMTSPRRTSSADFDFYCPVCKDVFQTPVRIITCKHVFCRKCFLYAMKSSGVFCPLCRGVVTKKERCLPKRATDIDEKMRTSLGNCKSCERQVKFYMMRRHYKTCNKYQEEYGTGPEESKLSFSQDSAGCSNRASATDSSNDSSNWAAVPDNERSSTQDSSSDSSNWAAFPEPERNIPTYKCPLCAERNMTRRSLLEHCNNRHRFEIIHVICPICASTPWGVPQHPISSFVEHLNLRHQFDFDEFVCFHLPSMGGSPANEMSPLRAFQDFQLDEETQFQAAVEQSYNLTH